MRRAGFSRGDIVAAVLADGTVHIGAAIRIGRIYGQGYPLTIQTADGVTLKTGQWEKILGTELPQEVDLRGISRFESVHHAQIGLGPLRDYWRLVYSGVRIGR